MTRYRKLAAAVAAMAIAPLVGALPAAPASAHGAMTSPVSRAAVCGLLNDGAKTAACEAALAVSGSSGIKAWDNLRVNGVNGRDRQVIPDGKLCSGGKPEYAGLDLPRADWPATKLTPGATFTFRYATTIPHAGTFRLYLTNASYRPTKRLAWSQVERQPFLTAEDPKVTGGAYTFRGKLPTGHTGRQILYTIWQNSSSADTYYSCSDVVFPAAAKPAPAPAKAADKPTATPTAAAPAGDGGPSTADRGVGTIGSAGPEVEPVARSEPLDAPGGALVLIVSGAAGLVAVVTVAVLLRRRRRPDGV